MKASITIKYRKMFILIYSSEGLVCSALSSSPINSVDRFDMNAAFTRCSNRVYIRYCDNPFSV